jgi:glycosyltransferase involved in cell wall biosynthesis
MATGRAVITTDTPGCRDPIVDGESGIIVPPQDAAALATAMRTFLQNPDQARQMGEKARAIAVDVYDVAKVNDILVGHMGLNQAATASVPPAPQMMAKQI